MAGGLSGADAFLETSRLRVRSFGPGDLPQAHRVLSRAFGDADALADPAALAERSEWLAWSALSHTWLPRMRQAPYGDRAVVLKASGVLIGAVGYVALLDVYDQLPELRAPGEESASGFTSPEVGLYWAIDPDHQRRGYATEAAGALVAHAFGALRLRRVVATTTHDNLASQAVMRRLGMRLARNPLPDPPWLQVVGILSNRHA